MSFLFCPDCLGNDFTEDFDCRECQTSLLTGKKISPKQNPALYDRMIAVSSKKIAGRRNRRFLFFTGTIGILLCLAIVIYHAELFGKSKSLETVKAQLSAQNDLHKFTVSTNLQNNLTAIMLTAKNIKITSDKKPASNIEMLFDCIVDSSALSQTPDEYRLTIISSDSNYQIAASPQLLLKTEKESFVLEQESHDYGANSALSAEYFVYRLSRKQLEIMAQDSQIEFQSGAYQGQVNFPTQQALRSYLIATSLDSRVD